MVLYFITFVSNFVLICYYMKITIKINGIQNEKVKLFSD